jgi:Asp/Glu/hydantoin racemase
MTTVGFINGSSGFSDEERAFRAQLYGRFLPGVEVRVEGIPDSPAFFDEGKHFTEALSAAEAYFGALDPNAFDVIVWAGAIDPGLAELRTLSPVPLIGPGEASMALAAVNGRPLSIVTVDQYAVPVTHAMLERVPSKPPIASVRHINVPVSTLVHDRPRGFAAMLAESRRAAEEDGAEAIYLGSMTLGTLGVDDELRSQLGVAVFNPLRIAATTAMQLVTARSGAAEMSEAVR